MTTLEKIRAEIFDTFLWEGETEENLNDSVRKCLEIIDKYAEPCDDAIDRAEAMTEIMMFAGNVKSDEEDIYIKVSDAVQLLRALPSVKPQEPTSVKHDAFPVKLQINKVSKHISNFDLDEFEQEPKIGYCRDCKWWKDKDGVYRRGLDAESECPINRKVVYEGNGYCYMFESQQESEE